MKNILPRHRILVLSWMIIFFFGIFLALPSFGQSSTRKLISKGTNGAPFGYFEYLPTGYSPTSDKKPLIIYLHGAGELGNGTSDLYKMKQRALPKLLQNGKNIPFVVIAPQAPTWWHNHDLLPMLEWVKKQYNIDPTRIYLTGISMGGNKVWDFGGDYPGKVTAILPMGADARNMNACRVSSLPVWAFHGAKDGIYPASAMTAAINKLNNECNPRANPAAKGTVYSDHGHDDLWDHVYNVAHGHDIYKWMLQYKKSTTTTTTNKPPVASAGPDMQITLPSNSAYIKGSGSDPDGSISKYWWSKISGPSGKMSQITSPTMRAYDLVAGTYEFELTVTDNKGATAKDRMRLVVQKSGSTGTTTAQGLAYKYYEGNWTMLPNFGALQPKKSGTISNFSISPRSRNDYFGFSFDGYIKITTAGTYTFYTKSDDGSKLYISGKQIVNNDELHGFRERSGSIYLAAGSHPIKVTYFERTGTGENLVVSYQGPGISKRTIPDAVLSTGSSNATSTATAQWSAEAEASSLEDKRLYFSAAAKQPGLLQLSSSEEVALLDGDALIYDTAGRVYTAQLKQGSSSTQWELATNQLHSGIYIVMLRQADGQIHRLRFIQP